MSAFKEIILIDEAYLTALLADIAKADKTIDLETYIFEDGMVGKQVTTALCAAAKRGVKVRVLVDGVGTMTWGGQVTKKLEACGIETKVFHPLPWQVWHWSRANHAPSFFISKLIYLLSCMNARNHKKVCMIDSYIVYVGSANIFDAMTTTKKHLCWRETTVKLVNVNTEEMQYAFNRAWGRMPLHQHVQAFFKYANKTSIFRLNYTWRYRRLYYKSMLNHIRNAKERIWITNAYFIPDIRLLRMLIKASRRGIDVRILLPSKSDVFIIPLAAATFYTILLNNGVSIYEYLPSILHTKVLIIDDWYLLGSSNLNSRSYRHDLEVDVDIRTADAKKILENQFLRDLDHSRQIKASDVFKQTIFKKWLGELILLMRYWI